jgi:hypothetical protein
MMLFGEKKKIEGLISWFFDNFLRLAKTSGGAQIEKIT